MIIISFRDLSGVVFNWTNLLVSEIALFTPSVYFSLSFIITILPFISFLDYVFISHEMFK